MAAKRKHYTDEETKLQWLRRALDEGEKDSVEGRTVSLEELNQHLDSIRQEIIRRQNK